ncbi:MAG TPA: FAD-dependent oxidoreductase [Armatimonadetes bacterium]|jgi:hypothetical protein|nr:FAD-dependent oxidoreductase [Armatimonadota bacterium]
MSYDELVFTRRIPVRHEVDVFVAGGGPAGIAAAIAAARQGRTVFLAEGHTCFGGMGTAGLVPAFMQFGDGVHFLAAGIGREVYDRLWEMGGTGPDNRRDNPRASLAIHAEVLKRLYDEMVVEAGVRFAFQTQCIAVEMGAPGRVDLAVCQAKSGLFAVKTRVFVDCTGDGDLAVWAGAPFEKGDAEGNLMPGTLCSLWADVDWDAVRASGLDPRQRILDAFKDKVFTYEDRHLPGMWRVGPRLAGGNIGHTFGVDSTDERSLTEALLLGRRQLVEYERFYKEYLKGFERMELVASGSLLGIRESRRILGDYVLNLEDFKRRAIFDDEIGRYSYPVDIHASRPGEKEYKQFEEEFRTLRYDKGESYGIPYRTLTPRGLENLLVAGRCISSDRYLQGSVRVMPGCFITGQAAGVAAALAVEHETGTRGFPIALLQERLKAMGAHLPNA